MKKYKICMQVGFNKYVKLGEYDGPSHGDALKRARKEHPEHSDKTFTSEPLKK